jgi:ribosomal protein L12E/L44/L45/RPP1/RPP2
MVLLDQKREGESLEDFGGVVDAASDVTVPDVPAVPDVTESANDNKNTQDKPEEEKEEKKDEDSLEDIPF